MVGCREVDNETPSSIEVAEFFDRGFTAPEGFFSNELDTINKLILLPDFWSSHGSKYQYFIILGYDVITLRVTDFSEKTATCVFGFEVWCLCIFRHGELVSIFQWCLPRQSSDSKQ